MIYAMGDIHGNLRRFNSVMEQIDLQPEDTLYVLGDVIDRHPYGIQILRKLMSMKNVRMILGNHEYMMMKAIGVPGEAKTASESATRLWYRNGGEVTHQALKRLRIKTRKEMFAYLHALPLNIDIEVGGETYRLVHGGDLGEYVRYRLDYYDETYFAVWKRYELTELRPRIYTMVFGHTPTEFYQDDTVMRIWHGERLIGIDCGSGYPDTSTYRGGAYGRLACLRLDDMKEFYSDEEY